MKISPMIKTCYVDAIHFMSLSRCDTTKKRNFPHRSHRAAQRQERFRALKRAATLEYAVSSEIDREKEETHGASCEMAPRLAHSDFRLLRERYAVRANRSPASTALARVPRPRQAPTSATARPGRSRSAPSGAFPPELRFLLPPAL
jgi:hypothetical protein